MTDQTDQQEPPNQQITVSITWPDDTYIDAEPANVFVFTDMGENVVIAMGFAPPPPRLDELVVAGSATIEAVRKRAFVIPKSAFLQLLGEMNRVVEKNPELFGQSQ